MKKIIIIVSVLLLLSVGAYAGCRFGKDVYLPKKRTAEALDKQEKLFDRVRPDTEKASQAARERAEGKTAAMTENSTEAAESPIAECSEFCPDTVGWLDIPDTRLSYPIVQCSDNSFYLNHGLDRESDPFGLPFLDYRCKGDFSGYNSIIYAHNFENMAMFANVGLFRDREYFDSHSKGLLMTDKGSEEIEFFAYVSVPADSPVYNTVFITEKEKKAYAELLLHSAVCRTDISAEDLTDKRLILLSTCTFEYKDARGILAGYLCG